MSQLINFIAKQIQQDLTIAISGSERLQIFFSGLPFELLEQLYDNITESGSHGIRLENANPPEVPTFLFDTTAQDPINYRSAARCSDSYFLQASRNNRNITVSLALHSETVSSTKSIDSTVTHIGIRNDLALPDEWASQRLVEQLINHSILAIGFSNRSCSLGNKAVKHAIDCIWSMDERNRDKRCVWSLLQRISSSEVSNEKPFQHLSALLGLPSCKDSQFGTTKHFATLDRISDFFDSAGLRKGFEELLETAPANLTQDLRSFQLFLEESGVFHASDFSKCALHAYCPIKSPTSSIPQWWHTLSVDVWEELLGLTIDPDNEKLQVIITNNVVIPPKGIPSLVRDSVSFEISTANDSPLPSLAISRSNGSSKFELLRTFDSSDELSLVFEDKNVPLHQKFLRYKFESEGYDPLTIKVIALNLYAPGVVALSRNSIKGSTFKLNRKAKDKSNKSIERYECDLNLAGMGSHQLDLYTSSNTIINDVLQGFEVDSEQSGVKEYPVNRVNSGHFVSLIETDEESYFDFEVSRNTTSDEQCNLFRIYVTATETELIGAKSEYERLIMSHQITEKNGNSCARVETPACRVATIEEWILENRESFHPVVLGTDYKSAWTEPDWTNAPVLSNRELIIDPRPSLEIFKAPDGFRNLRDQLMDYLRPEKDVPTESAGRLALHNHMRNAQFVECLKNYLTEYLEWLNQDYDSAVWTDVISLHDTYNGSNSLNDIPFAILLTPFHPLRLVWQCQAQHVLQDALDQNTRCPAASLFTPSRFPDCITMPCRDSSGRMDKQVYAALETTSDYWSVLWSTQKLELLRSASETTDIFNSEFGIGIEGLADGFSTQQVVRSIDEVTRLKSGKAELKIGICSDGAGSSSVNEGIDSWCSENLGDEEDYWAVAGKKSMVVTDQRAVDLQPEQSALASLTARSSASLKWYTKSPSEKQQKRDLEIIAHLGTTHQRFKSQGIRSAIDQSSLIRWRIRKQLPEQNKVFIGESRIGSIPKVDEGPLSYNLLLCLDAIESSCRDVADSYEFAPNMDILEKAIAQSWYTAVSSSDVDAACFFGTTGKAYMWDYELPTFSHRGGGNSGYYLLATESPSMLLAIKNALCLISDKKDFSDNDISSLLSEISRRGMPTLKKLTSGGTMSLGEVGMLLALRLLQSSFDRPRERESLLDVVSNGEHINLIIPADPFQNQFEDLRLALEKKTGERPDLFVLSFAFCAGQRPSLKITPIEVKARGNVMTPSAKQSALRQPKSFATFINKMQRFGHDSEIWSIAFRGMLASLIDYGFRVYGQLEEYMQKEEWVKKHSAVLQALASDDLDIEIDEAGRLIVIDQSDRSYPEDLDGDGFNETMVISHADAYSLLSEEYGDFIKGVRSKVGDWKLNSHLQSGGVNNDDDDDVAPPPDDPYDKRNLVQGLRFSVGTTVGEFTSEELFYYPGNTALNQLNVGIAGDLGTGKTQLIQGLIYQLTNNPNLNRGTNPNILIFDYKKDYSKDDFVRKTGAKVVQPFDIPLNLFDVRDLSNQRNAWLGRAKFFSDILTKIYSGIGHPQRQKLKTAIRAAYDNQHGVYAPTLENVFDAYCEETGGSIDSPYSIMSDLIDGGYFVSSPEDVVPFSEFLKGIVVIDLAEVGQDDQTKNMLVVIFLNLFYEHMLKIKKKPFFGKSPQLRYVDTMLLVDEADNIMKYEFDVLKRILLQGREFGVGVLLASQYLSHFKTQHENYLEPLLTWFVHKVPNISVKELEGIGLSNVDSALVDTIKSLDCHECLYKSLDVDKRIIRGKPFFEM